MNHAHRVVVTELRKEKGGRNNSMVANLIVHAGEAGALALQSMQPSMFSSGGKLRDGTADGTAAGWLSSPDSHSRRQPRSQTQQQVTCLLLRKRAAQPRENASRAIIALWLQQPVVT